MNWSYTHKIADIVFSTESNYHLGHLERGLFPKFICEGVEAEVLQRFHQVHPNPNGVEGMAYERTDRADENLLQASFIRQRCLDVLGNAGQAEIAADKNQVIIRDFSHREVDFFFRREPGSDDARLEEVVISLGYPSSSALRQIFSTFLPTFSAALVHSSGVVRNGLAALFVAPSTGGKTTVTKLSNNDPVLSDDQVVFRKNKDGVMAYSTPFGRVTNGPNSAAIGGIFLLKKAVRFELKPLKPVDMLEYIWASQIEYTYFLPSDVRVLLYQMLYDACHQVPCYAMHFPKDHVDWEAIDHAMEK